MNTGEELTGLTVFEDSKCTHQVKIDNELFIAEMHVRKHRLSNQIRVLCRFNSEKVCAIYKYLVNSRTLTMKSIKIFNKSIQLLNVVLVHTFYTED